MKVSFNMTSKEEAKKKVKTWPELPPHDGTSITSEDKTD